MFQEQTACEPLTVNAQSKRIHSRLMKIWNILIKLHISDS